jgi:hypothetical protein
MQKNLILIILPSSYSSQEVPYLLKKFKGISRPSPFIKIFVGVQGAVFIKRAPWPPEAGSMLLHPFARPGSFPKLQTASQILYFYILDGQV